jgi:hypothetical protein
VRSIYEVDDVAISEFLEEYKKTFLLDHEIGRPSVMVSQPHSLAMTIQATMPPRNDQKQINKEKHNEQPSFRDFFSAIQGNL